MAEASSTGELPVPAPPTAVEILPDSVVEALVLRHEGELSALNRQLDELVRQADAAEARLKSHPASGTIDDAFEIELLGAVATHAYQIRQAAEDTKDTSRPVADRYDDAVAEVTDEIHGGGDTAVPPAPHEESRAIPTRTASTDSIQSPSTPPFSSAPVLEAHNGDERIYAVPEKTTLSLQPVEVAVQETPPSEIAIAALPPPPVALPKPPRTVVVSRPGPSARQTVAEPAPVSAPGTAPAIVGLPLSGENSVNSLATASETEDLDDKRTADVQETTRRRTRPSRSGVLGRIPPRLLIQVGVAAVIVALVLLKLG